MLIRGAERADEIAELIAKEQTGAAKPIRPKSLPKDVVIQRHRSLYQAPDQWV
jgi:hypothetical protein